MVQSLSELLEFDCFTLDLARGSLRVGGEEITPRPKTFAVLRHLAENAGRLVLKEEIYEAVWPDAAVTDDVLVQCIRELHRTLADEEHRLIRTVPRRGYLLDIEQGKKPPRLPFTPARVPTSALNKFFTKADAARVAEIARSKQLPLPLIEFDTPDDDVPSEIRRFVGLWVSDKGFVNTGRQFLFLVNHIEKQGLAGGWTARGPAAPNSRIQNPAEAVPFTAYISSNLLTYRNPRGDYEVWFSEQGGLVFKQTYISGDMTMVALDPIWTLLEAETTHAQPT
jgi:DNA-binding winged helix-turn-helix (wHTH) protein